MGDDMDDIYGDLCPPSAKTTPRRDNSDSLGGALATTHLSGDPLEQARLPVPRDPRRGASRPEPPRWEAESWQYPDTIIVEAGEVVTPTRAAAPEPRGSAPTAAAPLPVDQTDDRPADFDALKKELLDDEEKAPDTGEQKDGAKDEDEVDFGDDDEDASASSGDENAVDVELGEVSASTTGVGSSFFSPRKPKAPRPGQSANVGAEGQRQRPPPGAKGKGKHRKEVPLFLGPPPPLSARSKPSADCALVLGVLPWWVSDLELRRHAEQFGPLRQLRLLDHFRSGKSTGIGLLEYVQPEAAREASSVATGLSSLAVWAASKMKPPRMVLVSSDLFQKMHNGSPSWADGGPCADTLRSILMRQFDLSHQLSTSSTLARTSSRLSEDSTAGLQRRNSGGRGPSRGNSRSDVEGDNEAWSQKLQALKGKVNRGTEAGGPPPAKMARR